MIHIDALIHVLPLVLFSPKSQRCLSKHRAISYNLPQKRATRLHRGTEQLQMPAPVAASRAKPVIFFAVCRLLASTSSSQTPRLVQVPDAREMDHPAMSNKPPNTSTNHSMIKTQYLIIYHLYDIKSIR